MDKKELIRTVASILEKASVPYTYVDEAALFLQGMEVALDRVEVLVQWDIFEKAYDLFADWDRSEVETNALAAGFFIRSGEDSVHVSCRFNTTIRTDPYRILVDGIWCRSLYSELYRGEGSNHSAITAFLQEKQQMFTKENERAWNQNNYAALLERYGQPHAVADKIKQNPGWRIFPFGKYMPNLAGKNVLHLLGSNGVKATALALMGAKVTVVDFSEENAAYARELAKAADVDISYVVSDAFSLDTEQMADTFDYVLMELGVLHYFITLEPLMALIEKVLVPGGRYVLHEFHPISTKLITSKGKKHKVTGNYFDPELTQQQVAFSKHMPEEKKKELNSTIHRKWTIGEVVTQVASSGMSIKVLEEEPNHKIHDIGLPKTYTLVAEK
ncbi:MAG: class I SAM-dependent methyltransferase [Bacillus sp. (in: firmicutes)]